MTRDDEVMAHRVRDILSDLQHDYAARPRAPRHLLAEAMRAATLAERLAQLESLKRWLDAWPKTAPATFRDLGPARLGALVPTKLRALAERWQPATDGPRLVIGPTGVGKTVAAVAALARLGGTFATALSLEEARRQHPLGRGRSDLEAAAAATKTLVLDDLGWERDSTAVLSVLAERYHAGLPTLVTSGLTLDDITTRYGEAVLRRMQECGGRRGKVLSLWPAKRAKGAA